MAPDQYTRAFGACVAQWLRVGNRLRTLTKRNKKAARAMPLSRGRRRTAAPASYKRRARPGS
jgi:hypothetical protein